jgi:hypothetical protein
MEVEMRYVRLPLAWIVSYFLVFPSIAYTSPGYPPIGVLTVAAHAHLEEATAFPGLSVFEGERLSTEEEGRLGIRVGRSALTLGESTEVELISVSGNVHIDMSAGSVRFFAAQNEGLEVHTVDALVCPATTEPTQGAVALLAPKVLEVKAEKGSLNFQFHGEFRNLPEGQTYRIYLDSPASPEDATGDGTPRAGRSGKVIYFIVGAGVAGGTAWGIAEAIRGGNAPISPARP